MTTFVMTRCRQLSLSISSIDMACSFYFVIQCICKMTVYGGLALYVTDVTVELNASSVASCEYKSNK